MEITIRRPEPHDTDQVRAISNAIYPERPEAASFWEAIAGTAAAVEAAESTNTATAPAPGEQSVAFVALAGGAVVGYASLRLESGFPRQWHYGRLTLGVAAAHRRQGIGSRLLTRILAETAGYAELRIRVKDSETEALAFLQRRGFHEHQRMLHLVQDLTALPHLTPQPLPEGITITTLEAELAENPDPWLAIHELENACFADIPSGDPFAPPPYDGFLRMMADPNILRDCFFLAKAGARYVGLSFAARLADQPDTLGHRFTGVLREYRGQGVAAGLKLAVTAYARSHGYTRVITATLDANSPMRAVNEALGFRRAYSEVRMRRVPPDIPLTK
jgi:mycothiol synthase